MFCPKCGNQILEGAKFCPKCGAKTGAQITAIAGESSSCATKQVDYTVPASFDTGIRPSLISKMVPIIAAVAIVVLAVFAIPRVVGVVAGLLNTGNSKASVVGTWSNESGSEVLVFEENGTCSVPFTYDGAWLESCDRYTVKDDGTLVLSSSRGNIRSRTYERVARRNEALENEGSYYLKGKEFIIKGRSYGRQ